MQLSIAHIYHMSKKSYKSTLYERRFRIELMLRIRSMSVYKVLPKVNGKRYH